MTEFDEWAEGLNWGESEKIPLNQIIQGNSLNIIENLPEKSINTCITSPPYWGLRDYGSNDQLGMEKTPEEFISNLVDVFREVKRVLKDDGTLWVNIGDSYAGYWGDKKAKEENRPSLADKKGFSMNSKPNFHEAFSGNSIKPKDLVGIPWMLAFALRADGWYLRQDIIWSKPNCMPESVTDRCTKSHEYIFMLSKSQKYYYDAESIRTRPSDSTFNRVNQDIENQSGSIGNGGAKTNGNMKAVLRSSDKQRGHSRRHVGFNDKWDNMSVEEQRSMGANKRSVWTVAPSNFREAHFATFPENLIIDCVKAGCPPGGVVLDPFMGAGTTGLVAAKLDRNYIGFELNPDYIKIAEKRILEYTKQTRFF